MARSVLMAKISGRLVWGRPRLGWIDGWRGRGLRQHRDDCEGCMTMRE